MSIPNYKKKYLDEVRPHLMKKFEFTEDVGGYFVNVLISTFLLIITLGFGTPWIICRFQKWKVKNTKYDNKNLAFIGSGNQLFGKWIIWFLLSLITLGIYSFWMAVKIQKYCIENTIIIDDDEHNNEINKVNIRQIEYENSVKKPLNLIILSFGFILSGFSMLAVFIGGMYLFILGFVAGVALLYYGFSKKSSK